MQLHKISYWWFKVDHKYVPISFGAATLPLSHFPIPTNWNFPYPSSVLLFSIRCILKFIKEVFPGFQENDGLDVRGLEGLIMVQCMPIRRTATSFRGHPIHSVRGDRKQRFTAVMTPLDILDIENLEPRTGSPVHDYGQGEASVPRSTEVSKNSFYI